LFRLMHTSSVLFSSLSRSCSVAAIALLGFCASIGNAGAQSSTIGTGVVRHGLTIGGSNRVEGSLQILSGEAVSFSGTSVVTADLLVPGTPTILFDDGRNYGGTLQGAGNAQPTNYTISGSGNFSLRHVITRTNPVALPAVPAPPQPTGTRNVTLSSATDSAGNFATLRNLTIGGSAGNVVVPPGTYGNFSISGKNSMTLGVAGATQPAVYNFQALAFTGNEDLRIVGPVVVTVNSAVTCGGRVGSLANPGWLKLRIASGNLTLTGNNTLYAEVVVPNGTVQFNGNSELVGSLTCDRLVLFGNNLLRFLVLNTPPSANDQSVLTKEDNAASIVLTGADAENNPLTYTVLSAPAHGTLSGSAPNLTYTPAANYFGSDSFTFRINDGQADSNVATVSITVTPENDMPAANAQERTTEEDTPVSIALSGSDVDGDPLSYRIVTAPAHGTLAGNAPQLTYIPSRNYNGPDGFTFVVNDGAVDSTIAAVSITVGPVNDPPEVVDAAVETDEDVDLPLVLTASDPEEDAVTFRILSQPQHGRLEGTPPNLTYKPELDYFGPDAFTFSAKDALDESGVGTVRITVKPINDRPSATEQNICATEDTARPVVLTGRDVDGDVLGFTIVLPPAHGTLTGDGAQRIYTPAPDYYGPDSFTFTATDGSLVSASATVTITVAPVNDPPAAVTQELTTTEDTALPIVLSATDIDGDVVTYRVVAPPQHGVLSGSAPHLLYTPAPDFYGKDSFTFVANDGTVDSAAAEVLITIQPINDPPTVQVTSPIGGSEFRADDIIRLTAVATDIDGSIENLSLLLDGVQVSAVSAGSIDFDLDGLAAGDHWLTATATDNDGALTTSSPVKLTIHPASSSGGPVSVNAGADRLVTMPAGAHLNGTVAVNGEPVAEGEVQIQWEKVSGPGNPTIDNSTALKPNVTFGVPGDYIFMLSATTAVGSASDMVRVSVLPPLQAAPDAPVSNQGREFWMTFTGAFAYNPSPDAGANLIISSETAATVTVEVFSVYRMNGEWQKNRSLRSFSVEAGKKTMVEVDEGFSQYRDQFDQALPTAIHIQSDAPVAVQALDHERNSTDGSLILPTGLLGQEYFVMSYINGVASSVFGTQFAVVATKPQTQVTITPTAATAHHPAGVPFTVTLEVGDVYRMQNTQDAMGDLTGSRIQSDKPVAVFAGHNLAYVPFDVPFGDQLYEQMPPVDLWGRHFVTMPLRGRTGGDLFRILAAADNTHVSINGEVVATLKRGQFYENVLKDPASIVADQRVLVAQFAQGHDLDWTTGDPFLSLVPPYEMFGRHYILGTPTFASYDYDQGRYLEVDIYDSYLTLIVDAAHTAEVTVNGQPIAASEFVPIADSIFAGASIAVPKNSTLDISSPTPIGTSLYGWAPYESYGFTGGLYGPLDAARSRIQLTQTSSSSPVGEAHRVRAQLTNAVGFPVPDARVDFSVLGVNSTTGSGLTTADGTVEFSWIGQHGGADVVTATTGTLTSTLNVTWVAGGVNREPQVNAGADVVLRLGDLLTLHGAVSDDGLPAGGQLALQWSTLPGPGDVTFSQPTAADTTATFLYPGRYGIRLSANDGEFTGDDDVLVTVDAPPSFGLVYADDTVDAGKNWDVHVEADDLDGRIVKVELLDAGLTIASLQPINDPVYPRIWEKITAVFTTVGPHQILVRLTDNLGITTERSLEVSVRPVPVVQLLSPAANTIFAPGQPVVFTASAESPGGAITRVDYQVLTPPDSYSIGTGDGADYRFEWMPYTSGTIQVVATAYDSNGASANSAPVSIELLSPGAPTVRITQPAAGSTVYLNQPVTVQAEATAMSPAQINVVNFYAGSDYLGSKYSAPFTARWIPRNTGPQVLRAEVYDSFGGYVTAEINVNAIVVPPIAASFDSPKADAYLQVNQPVRLAATATGVIGTLRQLDFYINDQWIRPDANGNAIWTPSAVGDYKVAVSPFAINPTQFGYESITVHVADLHPPVVQLTAPIDGASFAPGTPIVLQAQASDVDGNLSLLQFQDAAELLSEVGVSGSASVASFTWENPAPGWHDVAAVVVDETQQAGSASIRVFVQRQVSNGLFAPTTLTADPSVSSVKLLWAAPANLTGVVGYVVERKLGRQGAWEEVATVDLGSVNYVDSTVIPETYYVYRVASLAQDGKISAYTNEATAVTRADVERYVVIDLGDSLQASGIAAAFLGGPEGLTNAVAQTGGGGTPVLPPFDVGAARAVSISDDGHILLAAVDAAGNEIPGKYFIWRPDGTPFSHSDDKFAAVRIAKDGTVVGSVERTHTLSGVQIPETHAVYFAKDAWSNPAAQPIDLTPTPEAYSDPAYPDNVGVEWLLSNFNSTGRPWWTPADPSKTGKFPWELIWRSGVSDRNRSGVMVGESTIVKQTTPWLQWVSSAVNDPAGAQLDAPWTDAGSAVVWPAGAQTVPQWNYVLDGSATHAEATAASLNDNGVVVGGMALNTTPARTQAFRSRGEQRGQKFDELGTLGDGRFSWAWEINNNGVAVGYSTLHNDDEAWRTQAVVWEADSNNPQALPTLLGTSVQYPDGYGYARSINDKNEVVGQSLAINMGDDAASLPAISAAAIWKKNAASDPTVPAFQQDPRWEITDLNAQISASATETLANGQTVTYRRWYLNTAVGVNKNGWVVGTGVRSTYNAQTNSLRNETRAFLLVPAGVTIKKVGTAAAPSTGLIVRRGDALEIKLGDFPQEQFPVARENITWEWNQLKRDGSFTGWQPFGDDGKGVSFQYTTAAGGIFQVRAVLNLGGAKQEVVYVRRRDEPNATDSSGNYNEAYARGKPDYLGVVDADWQISVRDAAHGALGSRKYAQAASLRLYPLGPLFRGADPTAVPPYEGENKCNAFVYQMATAGGVYVPLIHGRFIDTNAPVAYDWWDPSTAIDKWVRLRDDEFPQPGFVVAGPDAASNGTTIRFGHSGILDYDGAWLQAGRLTVNKYPHLSTAQEPPYQPAGFRRYSP